MVISQLDHYRRNFPQYSSSILCFTIPFHRDSFKSFKLGVGSFHHLYYSITKNRIKDKVVK